MEDLKEEVLSDVRALAAERPFDAILIGGDIAFSATAAEYGIAEDFIEGLRSAAGGLEPGQLWVVPGNHDVSRAAIDASPYAQQLRTELGEAEPTAVDWILQDRVAKDPAGEALLLPLAAYNVFADRYGCATHASKLAWEDDSLVVDGWSVRLVGINSVINSVGHDPKATLVVGRNQCRIPRRHTTIRLLMLHHPPAWLKDWSQIEGHVRRAHLVLYGHQHALEAHQDVDGGTVEVSAGALSPELDAGGLVAPYIPTFNVIELARTHDDRLHVSVQSRAWRDDTTRFDADGEPIEYQVGLEPAVAPGAVVEADLGAEGAHMSDAAPLVESTDQTDVGSDEATRRRDLRNAGVRFLQMQPFRRIELARNLGVLTDVDAQLAPSELGGTILRRIREANLTHRLIEEMEK